jgi:hypothetical protein
VSLSERCAKPETILNDGAESHVFCLGRRQCHHFLFPRVPVNEASSEEPKKPLDRYNSSQMPCDFMVAKHILRYLKGTKSLRLCYGSEAVAADPRLVRLGECGGTGANDLTGLSDSDWAGLHSALKHEFCKNSVICCVSGVPEKGA